jgi:hypothetical protein
MLTCEPIASRFTSPSTAAGEPPSRGPPRERHATPAPFRERYGTNPSVAGAQVTYAATVGPAPSGGTVSFTDNGSPIAGCAEQPADTTIGAGRLPRDLCQRRRPYDHRRLLRRHLQVAPGATLQAGYDFTLPGNHNSLTMTVSAAQVAFAVACMSGATPSASTFTVTMPARPTRSPTTSGTQAATSPAPDTAPIRDGH